MKQFLSHSPMAGIALGVPTGIAAYYLFPASWVAMGCMVGLTIAFLVSRHTLYAVLALAAGIGYADAMLHTPAPFPEALTDKEIRYAATVDMTSFPENGNARIDCTIDSVDGVKIPRPFKVRIVYLSLQPPIAPGQHISLIGELSGVSTYTRLPDETNFGAIMLREGIVASASIEPENLLSVTGTPSRGYSARMSLKGRLAQLHLSNSTFNFLSAVLLGESSDVPTDTRLCLSRAGIAHILALSGLHVGIIAMILAGMLYPLTFFGLHRVRMALTILALWVFAFITGMSTSVVRATIMASMVLVGKITERSNNPLNSLCVAALAILFFNPAALISPGFQLSFSAVAAILLLSEPLNPFPLKKKWLHAAFSFIAASVCALLTAGVLSTFYFHTFPVYSILGNIVSSILLPPLLCLAVAALIVSLFMGVPGWLTTCLDRIYEALELTWQAIASLPGSTVDNLYFSPWALAAAIAAVGCIAWSVLTKRRVGYIYAAMLAVSAFALAYALTPTLPLREMHISGTRSQTTVTVRDGDSLLLVTTAPANEHEQIKEWWERHYGDYRRRRQLPPPRIAAHEHSGEWFSRHGALLTFGNTTIVLISSNSDTTGMPRKVNRVILAKGFTGNATTTALRLGADTVVVSADINRRRAMRYGRELYRAGIPALIYR